MKKAILRFFVTVIFSTATVLSGHSQDRERNMGIAVFQAPEAGVGVCFGSDGEKTIKCAREKCIADSGLEAEDCIASLWCYPMNWTADVFMQHREGNHWHEFICGQTDKVALQNAVQKKCAPGYLIECAIVQIWSPDGRKLP